ncbi:MAG: HupE/UreJ family protein [Pseudomonadota bacterium]|nr:HupE/UreJ family protein [Pseudomonadota bacterium]|tara:strand:- start:186 stop:1160 length:975 start_codon:yes stop_codon:yes gene_type:complete
MKRLFGCFVLMCCWISFSQAHEVRPAFLKVTETNLETDRSEFEISFRQPQINGRFLGLSVSTNCDATELSASLTDGALTEVFALECEEESLQYIEVDGLDRTLIDTLVNIKRLDGSINEILINGNEPRLDLTVATPTVPVYLIIGIEHLLLGFDHILFVIMLLYLVRSSWQILKVVTSFTIAHSLTLALSALELVQLSSAPVEAVIAGSIVLLAYENLQKKGSVSKTFPVLIAFGFGLLHGLGFAGAVAEIGLPEESQLIALLLFNIGIELGQLAIIAFVLLLLMVMRLKFIRLLYEVPIYLTGGIASFWFLQRSWQILAPGIG